MEFTSTAERCDCFKIRMEDLARFERNLRDCGFTEPPQLVKGRQVFGLSKELDDVWQLHIRGYEDGCLHSEVELRWIYAEHANEPSRPGHPWILDLLKKFRIEYSEREPPEGCLRIKLEPPKTLTEWKSLSANSFARALINSGLPRKLSIGELESFLENARLPFLTSIELKELLQVEKKDGKVRVGVNCPIYKVYNDWCEKSCISLVNSLLGNLKETVAFQRLHKRPESQSCLFEFYLPQG
ncbi:MAG: hypothetical protein QXJ75_04170 [Candidatus Bathyarchaeia archaeon]